MLYHSLAIPIVAALVYLILDQVPMGSLRSPGEGDGPSGSISEKPHRSIVVAITAGYMLTSVGGMAFAYGGRNWIAHGVYLVGLSLVFYAGVLLTVALWPGRGWRTDPTRHAQFGRHSAGAPGLFPGCRVYARFSGHRRRSRAFFGNGFVAFLAEDIVRQESHSLFQLMIIAHLHIMLTLIDLMILLLVIRMYRVQGRAHKIAVPLTIVGTAILTLATWSVMGWEGAHRIINIGSALLLPGAILVSVWGFANVVIRGQLGREPASLRRRLGALLHDPVRFGVFFELIFVNFVVTVPGVYVAFNLETYRSPAYLAVERSILVGHWHILATLSAVLVLFLIADRLSTRGWVRQAVGWDLLLGSSLSFLFVTIYLFRQPGQEKAWTVPLFETGIAMSLLALALFADVQVTRQDWRKA